MSNSTDFDYLVGGKPLRVIFLTSGTGTFVPLVDQSRCFVWLQQGGNGGGYSPGPGGSLGGAAGACVELMIRIPIAGYTYIVGAGGAADGGVGSPTSLNYGWFAAGPTVTRPGCAGPSGGVGGISDGSSYQGAGEPGGSFGGPAGGVGGAANAVTHRGGGGGGGSSYYGAGGAGGAGGAPGSAGIGFGSGGGGGGGYGHGAVGNGGCIEIWEFGA